MINVNWKHGDDAILYTGLSNYMSDLEKEIPTIKEAIKCNESFKLLLDNHQKTIKRIEEILEEL